MLTEVDTLSVWVQMKKRLPGAQEEKLIPLYALEILHRWGWPYAPVPLESAMPPINQTFLGYYPETGWLLDYWKDGYVPYQEDMPTHWLSMNVLPVPDCD